MPEGVGYGSQAGQQHKPGELMKLGAEWLSRIEKQLKKRDEGWGKDAEASLKAYAKGATESEHGRSYDFAIHFSNAETIVPAIINSPPVPDIRERHARGDTPARRVADLLENVISVQTDDNALDIELEAAAKDAFLAGRGIVRVRFDADDGQDGDLVDERVTYEVVPWRDYVEGPATRWQGVNWIAFRHRLDKAELERLGDKDLMSQQDAADELGHDEDVTVWEIWCRDAREVKFVHQDGRVLKITPDPLGLKGFYPVPEPVQPVSIAGKREPVVPFSAYRALADELDQTTRRINAILKGLKVRGIIITGAEDIARLSEAGDNELVPVSGVEGLVQAGGLSKAIEWWPIETAVKVLEQLYVSREQTKQAIYEVTGISDIIRGATEAAETATAQQIKTQWGSLRVKRLQTMVERHARDLFVLTAELIAKHFSTRTILMQAGLQPEEYDPDMEGLLRDPLSHYRIDVESDSTVRADLARSRQEMSAFLEGTATYFQVMHQVVGAMPAVGGAVVNIYAAFARQFNLGRQAEDALDEMIQMASQAAQEPPPNPEAEAAKAEAEAKAMEADNRAFEMQERLRFDRDKAAADMRLKDAELGLKAQDRQLKALDIALKRQQLGLEEGKAMVDAALRAEQMDMDREHAEEELEIERSQQRAAKVGKD